MAMSAVKPFAGVSERIAPSFTVPIAISPTVQGSPSTQYSLQGESFHTLKEALENMTRP